MCVYAFLINLVYFPIAVACMARENSASRYPDMIQRWRSDDFPGTKSLTRYMRDECIRLSVFAVTLWQIASMGGLYYYAEYFF